MGSRQTLTDSHSLALYGLYPPAIKTFSKMTDEVFLEDCYRRNLRREPDSIG